MRDIFTDLYNKVLGFFRQAEKKEEESTKDVACNRLKFVLMQDRTNLTPELMDRMRKELVELLSKYVEMDKEALELGFEQEGTQMALMLSIPVVRAKDEAEIEAVLAKEDEEKAKLAEANAKEDSEESAEVSADEVSDEVEEASEDVTEEITAETDDKSEEQTEGQTEEPKEISAVQKPIKGNAKKSAVSAEDEEEKIAKSAK